MKTAIISISVLVLITIFGFSCKTNTLKQEQRISEITQKVESGRYTFTPQRAIPLGGRAVDINSFELKISKDTIDSYLPYFGRAYSAPISSDDNGIKFVSMDFDYTLSAKNKGMWEVTINTKDIRRNYNMILKIGDTGYATLIVNETSRQPISFYGIIE